MSTVCSFGRDDSVSLAAQVIPQYVHHQIGFKNQTGVDKEPITREKAVSLIKDVFISAAERDIYTGDGLKIHIISAEGIETELIPLRRD